MSDTFHTVQLNSFADELQKIAAAPGVGRRAWDAAKGVGKSYGKAFAGGDKKHIKSRIKGKTFRQVESLTGMPEFRAAAGNSKARKEIGKVMAARAGTAAAVGIGGSKAVGSHRKTERRQLGRAYVTGARDMYGQVLRAQYGG